MVPLRWVAAISLLIVATLGHSQNGRKPDWISRTPVDEFSYYGIGISTTNDTDYREKARAIALKEITEKIFVSIDSESNLKMSYSGANISYHLNEDIKTISGGKLQGYKKVADWHDYREGLYYVLFRLDKDLYQRQRSEYFERVFDKIQFRKDRASRFFLINDYTSAIAYLESALEFIDEEFSSFPEPKFAYALQSEHDKITADYQERISRIRIEVEPKDVIFNPISDVETVVYYRAINRTTGEKLINFPVKLNVVSGEIFDYEVKEGADYSEIHIRGLIPYQGEALLRIQPDLTGKYLESNDLLSRLVNFTESPTFSISFSSYSVVFENKNRPSPVDVRLESFFSSFLEFCSITTTEDPEEAVYFVSIPSEMVSKSSSKGIITEIEGKLVVKNKDGNIVFKTDYAKASALGSSLVVSQSRALESLLSSVYDPLQQMTRFFCGNKH
jgi:hypothetical protein